jgi:uncharacterized repeat protein (TIGR01451 family)
MKRVLFIPIVIVLLVLWAASSMVHQAQAGGPDSPLAVGPTPAPKGTGPLGPNRISTAFTVIAGNPITLLVATDGSAQVFYNYVPPVSPNGQFYPAGNNNADMGIFLWASGSAFGPNFAAHDGGSAYGGYPIPFTELSQSPVTGNGTAGNPFVITTTLGISNTGLTVAQKLTYVNGQQFFRQDTTISNVAAATISNGPSAPQTLTYFHAGDIYLKGSDNGYGYYDPATGAIGGKNQAQDWFVLFQPLSPAPSKYEENGFQTIWGRIGYNGAQGIGFQNNVSPLAYIDNGAGLQWSNIALLTGQSTTISDFVTFGTRPIAVNQVDLSINKSASPNPVLVGSNLTFQLAVMNSGTLTATNVMVTDTLPANVTFVSATPSQGSCNQVAGVVKCGLGTLLGGASATINIVVVPTAVGPLSNTATVAGNESESNTTNNSSTANVTVISSSPPAQVPEGDTLILVGTGLVGLAGYAGFMWRARRAK